MQTHRESMSITFFGSCAEEDSIPVYLYYDVTCPPHKRVFNNRFRPYKSKYDLV